MPSTICATVGLNAFIHGPESLLTLFTLRTVWSNFEIGDMRFCKSVRELKERQPADTSHSQGEGKPIKTFSSTLTRLETSRTSVGEMPLFTALLQPFSYPQTRFTSSTTSRTVSSTGSDSSNGSIDTLVNYQGITLTCTARRIGPSTSIPVAATAILPNLSTSTATAACDSGGGSVINLCDCFVQLDLHTRAFQRQQSKSVASPREARDSVGCESHPAGAIHRFASPHFDPFATSLPDIMADGILAREPITLSSLPLELLPLLLEPLAGRRGDLASAALVSREWSSIANRLLYRWVRLWGRDLVSFARIRLQVDRKADAQQRRLCPNCSRRSPTLPSFAPSS